MHNIVIFEDGKGARGQKAKLIKRGNKRVLIEFLKYDYEFEQALLVIEWFPIFIPSWCDYKDSYKHNNKRKQANYCHAGTNMFYNDYWQTPEYMAVVKDCFTEEYYNELFGE